MYQAARTPDDQKAKDQESEKGESANPFNVDVGRLRSWAVICCTYVPGTNDLVFSPEHLPQILDGPASFLAPIKEAAMSLLGSGGVEEAKNS